MPESGGRHLSLGAAIYESRIFLGLLLAIAIGGVALAIGFTLFGFAWPAGSFRPITLSDEVEALLALGTLALAYAAVLQTVSALEQARLSGIREARQYRANLVLTLFESPSTLDKPETVGSVLAIRNLGPGIAKSPTVTFLAYPSNEKAEAAQTRLGLNYTSTFGVGRPYLDVAPNPAALWPFHSELWPKDNSIRPIVENLLDIQSDYIVEIGSEDLLGKPPVVERLRLQRRLAERVKDGSLIKSWIWFRVDDSGEAIESIDEILEQVRTGTWTPPWKKQPRDSPG